MTHAAQNTVNGVASNGSDWVLDVVITDQNGDPLTGVDGDTWQFQIRSDERESSTVKTFSTGSTLTVTEAEGQTTLSIAIPQASISDLCGDYIIDIVSKATSGGRLTHRAHGQLTVKNAPIEF